MRTRCSVGGSAIATLLVRRPSCRPQLIPVMVTAEPDAVAAQPSTVAATIEIDLADKYRVRISGGIDAHALRRVLDVLERR
jgi:hypothetical protein